jgi:hypothetical protein
MSTRCNVVIKDDMDALYFYRHSDGDPEGVKDTLSTLVSWYNKGLIRRNASQSSGWLVLLGMQESRMFTYVPIEKRIKNGNAYATVDPKLSEIKPTDTLHEWKIGAYEPTRQLHGDIDFLYTIDLTLKGEIKCTYETVEYTEGSNYEQGFVNKKTLECDDTLNEVVK